MINKMIMKLLREKTGVSDQRIYQMIDQKKKEYGYTISKEMAACLVAADNGIDISKVIPEEELRKLQELKETKIVTKPEKRSPRERQAEQIVVDAAGFKVLDPFLSKRLINEASEMAKAYPMFYIFENSIRNLILVVLENKYGSDWWNSRVTKGVKDNVETRLAKEKINKWHGKRGVHKIFYTDIGDLNSVITNNWSDFKDIFPSLDWIRIRIGEIEHSRNTIAHNNPLADRDIARVKLYFEDWVRQIGECELLKKLVFPATAIHSVIH